MAVIKKSAAKKAVAKPVVKKAVAKPVVKKAMAKPVVKKAMAKPAAKKPAGGLVKTAPSGWKRNAGGLVLVGERINFVSLTPASKLRKGLSAAQAEIKESLQEIATLLTLNFEVAEIELSISFNADGKFLGFGVGGATSIKVKIRPVEEEDDA